MVFNKVVCLVEFACKSVWVGSVQVSECLNGDVVSEALLCFSALHNLSDSACGLRNFSQELFNLFGVEFG